MTMKDRHILQEVLRSSYRMQNRADDIAKRVTKARAAKKAPAPEAPKPNGAVKSRVEQAGEEGSNPYRPGAADLPFPLPVAKGVTGPLGNLVNGQRFFVPGVIGDFVLEGWKLAPGVFDAKGELRRCPEVRQITQRRTATRPETLLKPTLMNAWFEETPVTVIENFALQTDKSQVDSNQVQGGNMAEKKAKKAKVAAAPKKSSLYTVIASKIDTKLQGQLDNKEKNSHGLVVLRVLTGSKKALDLPEIIERVKATKLYKTEGNPDGLITGDVRILTEKGILKAQEAA